MKIIFTIVIITVVLSIKAFPQKPSEMPDYSPLVPRLLSLNYKVNSNSVKNKRISADKLNMSSQEEFINIYVTYELDMDKIKNDINNTYLKINHLPDQLMNLDIIYSYRYLIPFTSVENLNKLLPSIDMGKDFQLEKIVASNLYVEKGKLKRKKISKKQIKSDTVSHKLRISIEEGPFKNNSVVEIIIKITSQYFNSINPTFNTSGNFERHLTLSMPSIFDYTYPTDHSVYKLEARDNAPLQLLQLHRESRDWNGVVGIYVTNCTTYSWKVLSDGGPLPNITFKLKGLRLPLNIDIGVPRTKLYKIDE
ncbi:MAG: hypothetical protein GXO86_11270 [Chlorobi bacterium]|nr:hypothetical protein [Chlorobiota bacterium]